MFMIVEPEEWSHGYYHFSKEPCPRCLETGSNPVCPFCNGFNYTHQYAFVEWQLEVEGHKVVFFPFGKAAAFSQNGSIVTGEITCINGLSLQSPRELATPLKLTRRHIEGHYPIHFENHCLVSYSCKVVGLSSPFEENRVGVSLDVGLPLPVYKQATLRSESLYDRFREWYDNWDLMGNEAREDFIARLTAWRKKCSETSL